jgi:hypothetical protein
MLKIQPPPSPSKKRMNSRIEGQTTEERTEMTPYGVGSFRT